jgi:hypothetical protein
MFPHLPAMARGLGSSADSVSSGSHGIVTGHFIEIFVDQKWLDRGHAPSKWKRGNHHRTILYPWGLEKWAGMVRSRFTITINKMSPLFRGIPTGTSEIQSYGKWMEWISWYENEMSGIE